MWARLKDYVPAVAWLGRYTRADFSGDSVAGLTTAVMLIPQGMAYAMLAGLPPIVGLYASTIPLVLYAIFGTSRELAVGPVAMDSLLVAAGVGALTQDPTEYVRLAIVLALMVGVIQLGLGLLRAGFLVNFLSRPVLSGFSSAAALIIGFSQLRHILGVDLPRSQQISTIFIDAVSRVSEVNGVSVAIGALGVVGLLVMKRLRPTFPRALIVVIASTLLVWVLGLHVDIVGQVPAGLPAFRLPSIGGADLEPLLPTAITIALVAFMESISVSKNLASKRGYEIQPNQELIALGLANLGGSVVGGYPVTGGFSRTAVNAQAGARTGMAALITASVIGLTLLFLTPLFHFLPKAALAAIIMAAVFGLVDLGQVRHLWKVKRSDLVLLAIAFFSTLTLGISAGIMVGVGASLVWFIIRSTRPHTAVLGRVAGTSSYRNIKRFPEVETMPGLLVLRVDAQFYFGNVTFLKNTLRRLEREASVPIRAVVIDASSINNLDSSADCALWEVAKDYRERGIELYFASVKGQVRDVMSKSGFERALGPDHFFFETHQAVEAATARIDGTWSRPPIPHEQPELALREPALNGATR